MSISKRRARDGMKPDGPFFQAYAQSFPLLAVILLGGGWLLRRRK